MYAIVDLETTGGNARWHRITELAIYVHDGEKLVDEYSTLVNPGVKIPPFITQLTGITNDMVADAPPFEAVAHIVHQMTDGCIFVAHNVGFDYNFLRAEFNRIGKEFERARLCTVRSSRKLLPGHASYSLGNICRDLGISNNARHRAAGDAKATMHLLEVMLQAHGNSGVQSNIIYQTPYQAYEGQLATLRLQDVPTSAGIIRALNPEGDIISAEVSGNLQKKALQLVKRKLARQARGQLSLMHDILAEETGSLLLATVLLEAEKIANGKSLKKSTARRWKIEPAPDTRGYIHLLVQECRPGEIHQFKTKKAAQEYVADKIRQLALCRSLTNLRPKKCLGNCGGVCAQTTAVAEYNRRIEMALAELTAPTSTNKLYLDKGRHPHEFAVLLEDGPDRWRWGYAYTEGQYKSPEDLAASALELISWPGASETITKFIQKFPVKKVINYGPEEIAFSGV
jgi:DNA polymerase-3 subunit epsilon